MFREIIIPLLIGITVFLFGMKLMELALHRWAGHYLHSWLSRLTRTPFRGLLTGTGTSALMQSSSAVTAITVGLVNSGVVTFPQTMGIILGTNIGTCITTELLGLQITKLGLPILVVSSIVWFASLLIRTEYRWLHNMRCLTLAFAGFACLLLGMEIMQSIVPDLRERGLFAWFVESAQRSLFWGILAGIILTAVIQSSAATIAITMGLVAADAISMHVGIAIVLGANIGTCTTAFMAGIGGTKYGMHVAWFHLLFNIGGAIVFFPLISLLGEVSAWLSPLPSQQLAHAQTIYNIVGSLLVLPLCYLPVFHRSRGGLGSG